MHGAHIVNARSSRVAFGIHALIRQVVHREHGRRISLASQPVAAFQIHRRQRPLPVVRVNDVRNGAELEDGCQDGANERREPVGVIRIVDARLSVQALPVEQVRGVHEPDAKAASDSAGRMSTVRPSNATVTGGPSRATPAAATAVQREGERNIMPGRREVPAQRAHDIGQSPGLRPGHRLTRNMQNPHGSVSRIDLEGICRHNT